MKNISKFITAFAFLIITLTACNNNTSEVASSDPKKVLQEFFEKLGNKDFDGAEKLATKDSKGTLNMMKQMMAMAESHNPDSSEKKDISEEWKDVEIGEAKINDNTAYVPFKKKTDSLEVEFLLKKEDGDWKVDFSMLTMMKLGMEQAKKKGIINDSTNLRDMQEMMQKGMKTRDSLMKKMDPATKERMEKTLKSYDSLQKAN